MIFYIKNSVLANAINYKLELENLITAFYRGKHIIDFESEFFAREKLLNSGLFEYNNEVRKAVNFYSEQKQNIKSLRKQVKHSVEVISNEPFQLITENSKVIISIDISYFDFELSPCYILSENLQDADFYISMLYNAKHFDSLPFLSDVNHSFEVDNGGGNTTNIVLERRINEKKILLCIVDSDKKFETDDYSGTSGSCFSTWNSLKEKNKIADLYILYVREKENLIPFSLYKQYNKFSGNQTILHLEQFEGTDKEKYLKFVKISDRCNMDYEKNSIVKDDLALTNAMRGIGKSGLRDFSVNKVYTEELALLPQIHTKSDENISNENLVNIFKDIPNYLQDDYTNLVEKIHAFTCSLDRVRYNS